MAVQFGNILSKFVTPVKVSTGTNVSSARSIDTKFKTAAYTSIPYERAPQVVDTVPTRDASGRPLLAGYSTPLKSWIC